MATRPELGPAALRLALKAWKVAPGLTESELAEVEARYKFTFAPDHRLMLSLGMPIHREYTGRSWPDWRDDDESYLRSWLSHPAEGILGAVEKSSFWYSGWGVRPPAVPAALALAEMKLAEAGQLVPVRGYNYLPSVPALPGNPMFSIWETDVIYSSADLLTFLSHRNGQSSRPTVDHRGTSFWSWLAEGGAGA